MGDLTEVDSRSVHALCCATWELCEGDLTWKLFEALISSCRCIDTTSSGFLLMHASWPGLSSREVQILTALAKTMAVAALQHLVICRLAVHDASGFDFHSNASFVRSPSCESVCYGHQKLGQLVHFVEATAFEGNPQSLLMCIEDFVKDDHRRWLKVAGGPKAQVVDMATRG